MYGMWYCWTNFFLNFGGIEVMEICCVGLVEQVHFYGCINLVGMCEILDIENFCWT